MPTDDTSPGTRVATIRQRRGLTQEELAAASGVSVATIRNMEQHPEGAQPRLSTLNALARGLKVRTGTLMSESHPEPDDPAPAEQWDDVRAAMYRPAPADAEPPSREEVAGSLAACMPLLAANRYGEVRAVLPQLIRDARALGGDGRPEQARVYNTAAWLLTMTRQWDDAAAAARLATDAASDPADILAAVNTTLWLHLRQGNLSGAAKLAEKAADDFEPRLRRTPVPVVAGWGKVMLGLDNAMVRDNSPGAAREAISCAYAAAYRIGREVVTDNSTTRTFGPASVAMIEAENAAICGHGGEVLGITGRVRAEYGDGLLLVHSAARMRSRLDVAHAHVLLGDRDSAAGVLDSIRTTAPEWLSRQRYARDIVGALWDAVKTRRRRVPENIRVLADAVRLPL